MILDPHDFPPPANVPIDPELLAAVAAFDDGLPWPDGSYVWRSADGATWVAVDRDGGDPREPYVQITIDGPDCQQRAAAAIRALAEVRRG